MLPSIRRIRVGGGIFLRIGSAASIKIQNIQNKYMNMTKIEINIST